VATLKTKSNGKKINSFFSARVDKEVAILRFQDNMLSRLADLKERDRLLNYIDRLSEYPSIKVVLMLHNPYKTGCREYFNFYRKLTDQNSDRTTLHRLGNIVNQLVLKIIESKLFFIHAGCGDAISLILNICMACDYRIVGKNSIFHNPYQEMGILPKGGGSFFILDKLGRSKAYEILLFRKDLPAKEALELGLLDRLVPEAWLEEVALKAAHRFGKVPNRTLSGIKKLLNHSLHDLKDILEIENQEICNTSECYLRNQINQLNDKVDQIEI
jgi:enoyl-CoA hydratase/carnithine racemase